MFYDMDFGFTKFQTQIQYQIPTLSVLIVVPERNLGNLHFRIGPPSLANCGG